MKDKLHYRDFEITTLPDYARQFRYQYEHKDFDGAPDAADMRYGSCETVEQCIEAIDEMWEEAEYWKLKKHTKTVGHTGVI